MPQLDRENSSLTVTRCMPNPPRLRRSTTSVNNFDYEDSSSDSLPVPRTGSSTGGCCAPSVWQYERVVEDPPRRPHERYLAKPLLLCWPHRSNGARTEPTGSGICDAGGPARLKLAVNIVACDPRSDPKAESSEIGHFPSIRNPNTRTAEQS